MQISKLKVAQSKNINFYLHNSLTVCGLRVDCYTETDQFAVQQTWPITIDTYNRPIRLIGVGEIGLKRWTGRVFVSIISSSKKFRQGQTLSVGTFCYHLDTGSSSEGVLTWDAMTLSAFQKYDGTLAQCTASTVTLAVVYIDKKAVASAIPRH